MRNLFHTVVILYFLTLTINMSGQQFLFESYSQNTIPNPQTVCVTNENEFIISGMNEGKISVVKLDNVGRQKDFSSIESPDKILQFAHLRNNDYIILLADSAVQPPVYSLQRRNISTDIIWEKQVESVPQNTIPKVSINNKDEIIIYSYIDTSSSLWVSHFDVESNNILKNNIKLYYGQIDDYEINLVLEHGFYYFSRNKNFTKMNMQGEKVWSTYTDYVKNVLVFNDRSALLIAEKKIKLYSPTGSQIKSISFTSSDKIMSAYLTDNNKIIIGTGGSVIKYDESLNHLWREEMHFQPTDFTMNNDWIVTTGIRNDRYTYSSRHLVQIPPDGIQEPQIALLSPTGNNIFDFGTMRINAYSKFVDNIKIQFSSDGGINWNEVATRRKLDGVLTYTWQLPNLFSSECFLLLTDAYNTSIKAQSNDAFSIFNFGQVDTIAANNIKMWIGANGMSSHDPYDDDSGLYWGEGNDRKPPATYVAGIVWGGKVNGEVRVGGSTYRYGLRPGPIISYEFHHQTYDKHSRIFKLAKNWQNLPEGELKNKYRLDYENWPGQYGAPHEDVNWDKQYSPGIDEPKILGDETLYYVANDMDEERTRYVYGSPPLGLEFRQTLFAYDTPELENVVFKKINLINKSQNTITDMYIGYWADDDLGFAGDDYIGCDSSLSLAFTWNGDNNDDDNYGENPPAIGRMILQGPTVPSLEDTAIKNERIIEGFKNLGMTNFFPYLKWGVWSDPWLGEYIGTLQVYDNLRSLKNDGNQIIDVHTGKTTDLPLSGDPESRTGWYQGEGWPGGPSPGDKRYLLSVGPYNMEPGDTQDVVYAILLARGTNNLNSITKLKEKAAELHDFWQEFVRIENEKKSQQVVKDYYLSQNYPNPFNPSTTIAYTIPAVTLSPVEGGPASQNVTLRIYDILGREVATLVNERQIPGKYWVEWDATNYASGIYFYRITIGNFTKTHKMMLLK